MSRVPQINRFTRTLDFSYTETLYAIQKPAF